MRKIQWKHPPIPPAKEKLKWKRNWHPNKWKKPQSTFRSFHKYKVKSKRFKIQFVLNMPVRASYLHLSLSITNLLNQNSNEGLKRWIVQGWRNLPWIQPALTPSTHWRDPKPSGHVSSLGPLGGVPRSWTWPSASLRRKVVMEVLPCSLG